MFILVDPNSVERPLDLNGVIRHFRVNSTQASEEVQQEDHNESAVFKKALTAYRKASKADLKKVFTAQDIMTHPVTTIDTKTPLEEVLKLFADKRYRHIPVVHGKKLMNLLSDRDVFQIQINQSQKSEPFYGHPILSYIKPKELLCAREKTAIPKIALLMLKKNIGCVPILNDEHELVGIVTRSDILRAIIQFGPIDLWL